jgi:hypothetical protein
MISLLVVSDFVGNKNIHAGIHIQVITANSRVVQVKVFLHVIIPSTREFQ